MANIKMWHQGGGSYSPLPCGDKNIFTCPESKRIAAEYMRDFFFLTNVFYPTYDSFGNGSYYQQEIAGEVQTGDIIWFGLVPPMHHTMDIAGYAERTSAYGSSLDSLGGFKGTLVTALFNKATDADNAVCEPIDIKTHGKLEFAAAPDVAQQFVRGEVNRTTTPTQWLGLGLRIDTMPKGETNLANITAKLVVGGHVLGYDAQTTM